MFLPESYAAALVLMVVSMLCWGSWANTLKLCPRFRFQLFYWDYAAGLALAAVVWGLTAGSLAGPGLPLMADLARAPLSAVLWAAVGGVVFNIANLLLVAAIDIAGLAVAFPVGIGLALVVGAVSSYLVSPAGNPLLLFAGVALVVVAIVLDAAAYRQRDVDALATTTRGIVLSLVAGVLMGCFYPFVARALTSSHGQPAPGPYAVAVFFAIGLLISTVPANWFLMRRPLDGKAPVNGRTYWQAPLGWHLAGVLGGVIWSTGTVANFVASGAHIVGPAVSYAFGQGATMVSACWGVFVWREFSSAPRRARQLLALMFFFFIAGLALVALAPLFK
jgi:glucose uptake protein